MPKKNIDKNKEVWVAVSGGFDPLHIGHIRMMKEAREMGDRLLVIINNDAWLRLKKGFVFMPESERKELISSFSFVDKVVLSDHEHNDTDMSVSRMLKKFRPHIFANGGDRKKENTPEDTLCISLGIKQAYCVGRGGKVQSSSWMIRDAIEGIRRSVRPWGKFYSWNKGEGWYLKTIHIDRGARLSLQYHNEREEYWLLVEGDATAILMDGSTVKEKKLIKGEVFSVGKREIHRLSSQNGGTVVEIALGNFDENDIVRLEDDHGRLSTP